MPEQLAARLSTKPSEDNFVERKPQSVKAHELRQTLVAFSNTLEERQTAVLFIGVDDKTGAILGVDDPDRIQKRIGEAGEDCYPAIRPAMTVLEAEGKRVVAIEISHSKLGERLALPVEQMVGRTVLGEPFWSPTSQLQEQTVTKKTKARLMNPFSVGINLTTGGCARRRTISSGGPRT